MNHDLWWSCLPIEARAEIRTNYAYGSNDVRTLLRTLFGTTNLISPNEPEETLMVKRSDVIDFYSKYIGNPTKEISRLQLRKEINSLFGDKCLPDKKESFKLGDKLVFKKRHEEKVYTHVGWYDEVGRIINLENNKKRNIIQAHESQLELYMKKEKETLNLSKLLKGLDNEIFYKPLLGNVTVTLSSDGKLLHIHQGDFTIDISWDGKDADGNMALFPSKDQRDWEVWEESRKYTMVITVKKVSSGKILEESDLLSKASSDFNMKELLDKIRKIL